MNISALGLLQYIHVTGETHAGGRRHMEDYIAVQLHSNEKFCKSHDHAFMAVFDSHGGKEHLPGQHPLKACVLTKDHNPKDPDETRLIQSLGESTLLYHTLF